MYAMTIMCSERHLTQLLFNIPTVSSAHHNDPHALRLINIRDVIDLLINLLLLLLAREIVAGGACRRTVTIIAASRHPEAGVDAALEVVLGVLLRQLGDGLLQHRDVFLLEALLELLPARNHTQSTTAVKVTVHTIIHNCI